MKFTTIISKMKSEFSLENATSFGGVKIFLQYLEKIKLRQAFEELNDRKSNNSLFPLYRILLYLVVGWAVGCERLFHFRKLKEDALIRRFLGGRCPHHSLLYKELERLGKHRPDLPAELRRLNTRVIAPSLPSDIILDLDSTVETVYGSQEGAAVGTNPHKPGRRSYHPLLAFEGQSRLCLNAHLRAGNTHSSTDWKSFLDETLTLMSDRKVKYARFDKGFAGEDFYTYLESRHIGFVGKLKWTQRLQKEVQQCRYWNRFVDDQWVIEGIRLIYRASSWDRAREVVVIRKVQLFDGDQKQLVFESDWQYEAIVTNLGWEALDIWRFYNQRCSMENYIKEAKRGFSMDRIATDGFAANEIDLLIKLLTYNLFERFKRDCCEPVHQGYTIARFRVEFFHCAATIISHGRRLLLKLAKTFFNRHAWQRIEAKVTALECGSLPMNHWK